MLNLIRMENYRLFKTRTIYTCLIVLALVTLLNTVLLKADMDMMESDDTQSTQTEYEDDTDTMQLGMVVSLPTEAFQKITVFDMIYASMSGRLFTLFVVIFAISFACADIKSGFVKNIGGQVRDRRMLILAKAVALAIAVIVITLASVLFQIACNLVLLGYVRMGSLRDFAAYMGVTLMLNYALALVFMMAVIVIKSRMIATILAVCVCVNMQLIIYSAVDRLIAKAGVKNFSLIEHTPAGLISMTSMSPDAKTAGTAALCAFIFGAVSIALTCGVFRRRDI